MKTKIRLFWWSEIRLMKKQNENYGDLIGKYLVEKISKKEVVWAHPKKFHLKDLFTPIYVTAGSILAHVNKKCVVWGSGIISKQYPVKNAVFLAVRGPQTRNYLIELGFNVPKVYGDPALLMPLFYNPKKTIKYTLGIVPHYKDFSKIKAMYANQKEILVIDLMTNNIEETTNLFLQCEKIISSSLHGLIVSHAYNIPSIWVPFSDKLFGDGVKFQDYFESVGIENYKIEIQNKKLDIKDIQAYFNDYSSLPEPNTINKLQEGLLAVCPFKVN